MKSFNHNVRGVLDPYYLEPYRLDTIGWRAVVESNANLGEEYFGHLEFPVTDFWFDYFSSKMSAVEPSCRGKALDVCAGTGTLCLNVMRKGMFSQCVAIDNSGFAVDRLSKRTQELGISGVIARKEDVMATRFESNEFDAVIGNSFLHHLPDNPAFLTEMHRVLKPGGVLCLTGEPTVASNILENAIMGSLLFVLRAVGLKKRPSAAQMQITDIWVYEASETRAMLEKCGYTDIRITPFGTLVPLFNGPTAYLRSFFTKRTLQPDWYWKYLGIIDKYLFAWLPANARSHFVISARKPQVTTASSASPI